MLKKDLQSLLQHVLLRLLCYLDAVCFNPIKQPGKLTRLKTFHM